MSRSGRHNECGGPSPLHDRSTRARGSLTLGPRTLTRRTSTLRTADTSRTRTRRPPYTGPRQDTTHDTPPDWVYTRGATTRGRTRKSYRAVRRLTVLTSTSVRGEANVVGRTTTAKSCNRCDAPGTHMRPTTKRDPSTGSSTTGTLCHVHVQITSMRAMCHGWTIDNAPELALPAFPYAPSASAGAGTAPRGLRSSSCSFFFSLWVVHSAAIISPPPHPLLRRRRRRRGTRAHVDDLTSRAGAARAAA